MNNLNLLFYDANPGEGAVGEIAGNTFKTTKSFGPGAFAKHWTHVRSTARGILFYNGNTGEAAIGSLSYGDFQTIETFPAGFFAPGWTHLSWIGGYLLFYWANTGEGALVGGFSSPAGIIATSKLYPANAFAHGWTHIVRSITGWPLELMLFYSTVTGAGAICEPIDTTPTPGQLFPTPDDIKTLKTFAPDSFAHGWSQIAPLASGDLLFYNQQTGAGLIGDLTKTGVTTKQAFPVASFAPGWTHVATIADSILFYNASTGAGAIGFNPTVKSFPAGSFAVGWTHIVGSIDIPPPK